MEDFILVCWELRFHIGAAFIVGTGMSLVPGKPHPDDTTTRQHRAPVPTHGPWAEHHPRCGCNVCR